MSETKIQKCYIEDFPDIHSNSHKCVESRIIIKLEAVGLPDDQAKGLVNELQRFT